MYTAQAKVDINTIPTLRGEVPLMQRAANCQATLQRQIEDLSHGDNFSRTVKSGRDRVGGLELSLSQWTDGLTGIRAEEKDPLVQRSMFVYLTSLL